MNKPKHIGIIMDGNGRWATHRNHPRYFGHLKGARVAKNIILECSKLKIEQLTLYAFSTENWLRPKEEINFILRVLTRYLQKETENLVKENIRFSVIGEIEKFPENIQSLIQKAIAATANCSGLKLTFALSYGGRNELALAAKKMAGDVLANKIFLPSINEALFNQYLSTYPAKDVDMLIRTSGEKRISNFLLWQSAYAELFFTNTLWPDFNLKELSFLLSEYSLRNRKFGKTESTYEELNH